VISVAAVTGGTRGIGLAIAKRPAAEGYRVATRTLAASEADNFSDPTRFRPERWMHFRPPMFASNPFGGGVHRRIAASFAAIEMRCVLHELARTTENLIAAPGRPDRHRSLFAVLVPSGGGRVIVAFRLTPADRLKQTVALDMATDTRNREGG
jgi:cytochrome P450